jgi:hypothetical protein
MTFYQRLRIWLASNSSSFVKTVLPRVALLVAVFVLASAAVQIVLPKAPEVHFFPPAIIVVMVLIDWLKGGGTTS